MEPILIFIWGFIVGTTVGAVATIIVRSPKGKREHSKKS